MKAAVLTAVAFAACVGLSHDARSATMPSFGSLPEGRVGTVPKAKMAPRWISGSERVAGLFVASPPKAQLQQMKKYGQPMWVSLFPNAQDAKRFSRGDAGDDANDPTVSTCFTNADRAQQFTSQFSDAERNEPVEWPPVFEWRPTIMARRPANQGSGGGITAVHMEKLTRGNEGQATLNMTDAWVDPDTGGARLIGTSSMPLVRVAAAPSGIEVYAARNGDEVEFVVTGSRLPNASEPGLARFAQQLTQMNASFGNTRFSFASSDCGHLRVALRAGTERGSPMSVVQTTALLPPLEKDNDAKSAGQERLAAFQAIQSIRKRPVHISLSATQVSGDKEPLLSVGIGWAGREARQ